MKAVSKEAYPRGQGAVIYGEYLRLLQHARDLAQIRIRDKYFVKALADNLKFVGGLAVWLGAHAMCALFIVLMAGNSEQYAQLITVVAATTLSYLVLLHNLTAFVCDLFWAKAKEGSAYAVDGFDRLVVLLINRHTVIYGGLAINSTTFLLSLVAPRLGQWALLTLAVLAVTVFLLNQVSNLVKSIGDYRRLLDALLGRPTVIVLTRGELVEKVRDIADGKGFIQDELVQLRDLGACELRHEEVRLQNNNIILALIAIIVSILLSNEISLVSRIVFEITSQALSWFSETTAVLLGFSQQTGSIFSRLLLIGLWGQVANLLIGGGYIAAKALAGVYFASYRPVFALHQALLLVCPKPRP